MMDGPESRYRLLWHLAALFAGCLPAVATAWATRSVIEVFGLVGEGTLGVGGVAAGLRESNRPLIAAGAIASCLALALCVIALLRSWEAAGFPGLTLSSLVPVAACVPAVLLWIAESLTIEVVAGRVESGVGVAEASTHLAALVLGSFFLGLALAGALGLAIILMYLRPRSRPVVSPKTLAAVWACNAALLLAVTVAYIMRSSALHEAALRGRF